ncbi:MAG: pilus assembly protein TadG-related protein, partial [Nocardioidaceae bacterium]
VIFALCSLLLFSVAALAVDLGNAEQRKVDTQTQADNAALAGGAGNNLPAPQATPLLSDPAVIAVAQYLNANQPQNDNPANAACTAARTCVTAASLVDGNKANGEVYYGSFNSGGTLVPNVNQLTVVTPQAQVNFGLAGAMGYSGTQVQSVATVEIQTPLLSHIVPFYAYSGCDYGGQTISNPSNGHSAAGIMLAYPADTNAAALTSVTPNQIALNDATSSLTIVGTSLTNVTQIGFFESGNGVAGPDPTQPPQTTVPAAGFTINAAGTQIKVNAPLPTNVASVQDTWFIRVLIGGKWSAVQDKFGNLLALPFVVGDPLLTCGQGSSQGNFGTVYLPNQSQSGQWQQIAANIANGLDGPLNIFPNAASDWTCVQGVPTGSVVVSNDPWTTPVNCLDTKTGLPANAATGGFITGIGSYQGLLTHVGSGTGCPNNGQPNNLPNTTTFGNYTINNDTLSCFFTDTTTNIGAIDSPTYTLSGPVLDQAIYNSPRFIWVPVFGTQPANGGSKKYQIVDFRPGFITDQVNSATQQTPLPPGDPNGVTGSGTVDSVEVDFINSQALPTPPNGGPTTPYTGTGPKVLRLVN